MNWPAQEVRWKWHWRWGIAGVAVATYWQGFSLPLISDDYLVIDLARQYAEEDGGWDTLLADPLYRTRGLFMWLTAHLNRWFGLKIGAYTAAGIGIHALTSLAAFEVGRRWFSPAFAGLMALFFAVHHGHQEAVWWYSALPDALVLLFAILALACWRRWCEGRNAAWYAATLLCFAFGLASKEAAVTIPGLLAGAAILLGLPTRRWLVATAPFGILSLLYFAASFAARESHPHFNDGTFALGLHFVGVVIWSIFRILWPWGLVSVALLAVTRRRHPAAARAVVAVLGWMVLTLLPYSFLTYMPFVPSRHTYAASLALALVLAAGLLAARTQWRLSLRTTAAIVALFTAIEWGYLWTRKFRQYRERAAPTEVLRQITSGRSGELRLACFPYPQVMIESLLRLTAEGHVRLVKEPGFRETFNCDTRESVRFIPD